MTNEEMSIEIMRVGIEAEKFKASELGRTILERAKMLEEDALNALAGCDPEDAKGIRTHQNSVYLARQFEAWIDEIIEAGEQEWKIHNNERME